MLYQKHSVQHLDCVLLAHVLYARSDVSVLHIIHLISYSPLSVCNFSSVPSLTTTQSQSTILSMTKHGTDPCTASCNPVLSWLQAHGTCIKVSFIGTQPEKQGQGLGGQLIRAVSMQDNSINRLGSAAGGCICCSACSALLYLHSCLRMYAITYSALLCCSDIIAMRRHNTLYSSLQSVYTPDRLEFAADKQSGRC